MIENPRAGEQIEFGARTPELRVIDTVWTRARHRAAEHVHPEMEKSFEVIEGEAVFRVGARGRIAGRGEVVIVAPALPTSPGIRSRGACACASPCGRPCAGRSSRTRGR